MSVFEEEYFSLVKSKFRSKYTLENMKKIYSIYWELLSKEKKIKKNNLILDVGCAFGYFLNYCDMLGYKTYGVDISKYAVRCAKENTKANLCVGDVNLKIPFTQSFDIVTLLDVIEHLNSPFNVLKDIYSILKPKGIVVITTPNFEALAKKLLIKNWHGFIDPTHIHFFTRKSISDLVRQAGFTVTCAMSLFLHFPRPLQIFLNKTKLGGQLWIIGRK